MWLITATSCAPPPPPTFNTFLRLWYTCRWIFGYCGWPNAKDVQQQLDLHCVVHVYNYIAFALLHLSTSWHFPLAHIWQLNMHPLTCSTKYGYNSCTQRCADALGCFHYFLIRKGEVHLLWHAAVVMCMYSACITICTQIIVHIYPWALLTCTVPHFVRVLPYTWTMVVNKVIKTSYWDNLGSRTAQSCPHQAESPVYGSFNWWRFLSGFLHVRSS